MPRNFDVPAIKAALREAKAGLKPLTKEANAAIRAEAKQKNLV